MNHRLKDQCMRVDKDFLKKIRGIIPKRIVNFPEENINKDFSDRELTRMIKNTRGFEESLKELETLPKRKAEEWK